MGELSDRAVTGAEFELLRQGGCGSGTLRLKDGFAESNAVEIGDFVAFERQEGERWYLGRVESREADSPAGVTFRLQGMVAELGEVFPGGFSPSLDGPPHRYGPVDRFTFDPDRADETYDSVDGLVPLIASVFASYVVPATNVTFDAGLIESPTSGVAASVGSFKFRGEESVRSLLNDLAVRAGGASWGVDEEGRFFFRNAPAAVGATFREGGDLTRLSASRDLDLLYNRILMTGGYVYREDELSGAATRRTFFRWRGNYFDPVSRDRYGERRIRVSVPWVRAEEDA
ncbi:MAG: hypothetical protein AAGJ97_15775, partial [Planctomycetota bacterium]